MDDVLDVVEVLLIGATTLADGGEVAVDGLGDVLLEGARAAVADLLGDLGLLAAGAQRRGRKEGRHAGAVLLVEVDVAVGVGRGLLDALGRLFLGHGQGDGVAVGLAHLAAVQTGDLDGVGEQRLGLREDLAVTLVEPACDKARGLDVGQLVLAHGHDVALAEQDVAGLVDGVGEQKAGERVARGLHLSLDGGVALQLSLGHKRQEGEHELVASGDGRVRVNGRLGGVDAAGQVVHDHVVHVVLDVGRGVAVGDDLVVGDEHHRVDAHVLQAHALADGAEVVAQVQTACGTVAREHAVVLGVQGKVFLDLVAALEACLEAAFVGHVIAPRHLESDSLACGLAARVYRVFIIDHYNHQEDL